MPVPETVPVRQILPLWRWVSQRRESPAFAGELTGRDQPCPLFFEGCAPRFVGELAPYVALNWSQFVNSCNHDYFRRRVLRNT